MSETGGGKEDIQVLRDVLLKPLYEQNKARDQKLVQFVEQFGAKLTTRLRDLEKRVDLLAAEIDKRENMVSGIGQGIASLGQELRQLASKAESLHVVPAPRQTARAESFEADPMPRQTARVESGEAEPMLEEAATDEWDEAEPQPRQAARDEWDETEPPPQEAAGTENDDAESLPKEDAGTESDQVERPQLRKTIRREGVQAVLPSRGFG